MNKIFFFSILACVLIFSACSVKDPEPIGAQTNASLLAGEVGKSKSWKLVSISYVLGLDPAESFTLSGCFTDNIYTFTNNASQNYEQSEGESKCGEGDPDVIQTGTWALSLDGKSLLIGVNETFSGNGLFSSENIEIVTLTTWRHYEFPYPAKIITFTDTRMVLEITVDSSRPSESKEYTMTFIDF